MAHKWTEEEIQYIEDHLGFKTIDQILFGIERINRKKNVPLRTLGSLNAYVTKNYPTRIATEDNLSLHRFAALLGVGYPTVKFWVAKKRLPTTKVKSNYTGHTRPVIKLVNFKEWAKTNLDRLKGLNYENLLWALNDSKLARELSSYKYQNKPVTLIRLGTDPKKYTSIANAAKDNLITSGGLRTAVSKARRNNKTVFESAGHQWKILS